MTAIPKASHQLDEIRIGSPLAIVGLMLEVVRARFSPPNLDTGYVWRADPTPAENEESTVDSPRTLYIESAYTEDPEARDLKPAILIDKEDTALQKLVIGNRADIDRRTRRESFWAMAQIPIAISCVSGNRGESAQLADFVWMHIAASTNYIRSGFSIHEITPPVLGRTQVFRRSAGGIDAWNTPISFALQVEFLWVTEPIAPLLQQIRSSLELKGDGDATAGAIESVLKSQRRL